MKKLVSIWKLELRKRIRHRERCERCDRNWLIHKSIGLSQFQAFADVALEDGVFFHVVDYCSNQSQSENGPWTEGQDSIVLGTLARLTGKETHYESLAGSHKEVVMEEGGSLVVHYTYAYGLVQVFMAPPRTQGAVIDKPEVMIFAGYDTDSLTSDFYSKQISRFLVFCRVESSLETSSIIDRSRVRWWKYMDIRNRRSLLGTSNRFLNHWELSAAAALVTVIGLLAAILSIP